MADSIAELTQHIAHYVHNVDEDRAHRRVALDDMRDIDRRRLTLEENKYLLQKKMVEGEDMDVMATLLQFDLTPHQIFLAMELFQSPEEKKRFLSLPQELRLQWLRFKWGDD
jgi:hypothetical protein